MDYLKVIYQGFLFNAIAVVGNLKICTFSS
jgi:hypothetical protein